MDAPSKIGVLSLLGAILLHLLLLIFFVYEDPVFLSLKNKSTYLYQVYPIRLYYSFPQKILENKQNRNSTHTAAIQQKKYLHEFKPQPQSQLSVNNEKYADEHQLNNLVALLHSAIQAHQQYPREAQLMHEEGVSVIGFTLQADGEIANVHIVKSSGNENIDNAALNAVKNSSPIELNTENVSFLKKNSHIFELKIAFNLS